jgi:Sec-independent protein secretion pathway component TatC
VGILSALGVSPDLLPLVAPIISVIGIVAIWALRERERAAWVAAIATGVFASPIFNLTNVTLLLAAFVVMDGRIGAWIDGRGATAKPHAAATT